MEQQLIDILKKAESPEGIDDVSKAMISARICNAVERLQTVVGGCLENLKRLSNEFETEFKLAGVAVIIGAGSNLIEQDSVSQFCVIGTKRNVQKQFEYIGEMING